MTKKHDSQGSGFDLSLGGIFKGLGDLGDLVGKLGELAEKGAQLRREGEIGNLGGVEDLKGIYGFSVKVGLGGKKVHVEPFGNIKKNKQGEPTVVDQREPIVDLFEEQDHVLVVVELPGVEDSQIKTELEGDLLLISAEGQNRKYRKEVLLPQMFESAAFSRSFRHGILEIRLERQGQ